MSYDVDSTCPCCSNYVFDVNHTMNTSRMWRKAGVDLQEFNGKKAEELIKPLKAAIDDIAINPNKYREFEPSNGWGTIQTTLEFLWAIHDGCVKCPSAVLRVSW